VKSPIVAGGPGVGVADFETEDAVVVAELEDAGDAAALEDEYRLIPPEPPHVWVESPSQGIEHTALDMEEPYIVLPQ
jgi:hypothetical protein